MNHLAPWFSLREFDLRGIAIPSFQGCNGVLVSKADPSSGAGGWQLYARLPEFWPKRCASPGGGAGVKDLWCQPPPLEASWVTLQIETGGWWGVCIVRLLYRREIWGTGGQVVSDDTVESGFQLLIQPFCLAVGLWVVTGAEVDLGP